MAYFNNAATTFPKPAEVLEKAIELYKNAGMNAGRSGAEDNTVAGGIIEKTRKELLELFHVDASYEVIFQPSATHALNVILQGLKYESIGTVYISPFEHNSVTRILHAMKQKYKFEVVQMAFDKAKMEYDFARINKQFAERKPNVVIVSHASNVCGVVAPLKDIFTQAKKHQAITIADMAQTAGLLDTNLSDSQVDCAIFAGHKTLYAATGVGGLIIRNSIKPSLVLFGGTGILSASQEMPDQLPARYEIGSPNILSIASLYYSLQWISRTTRKAIEEKDKICYNTLLKLLQRYKNIKLVGIAKDTVGIVSCLFDRLSSEEVGKIMSEHGVEVRTGLHCSPYAHEFLGTYPAGTVRFSVGYFTADSDFAKLEEVLDYIEENT